MVRVNVAVQRTPYFTVYAVNTNEKWMSFSFRQSEVLCDDSLANGKGWTLALRRCVNNYLICWCGKRRMQTHKSIVRVSWRCGANLVPRSFFHYTQVRKWSHLGEWWMVSGERRVRWSTGVCSLYASNERQMLRKEYETKFIIRLLNGRCCDSSWTRLCILHIQVHLNQLFRSVGGFFGQHFDWMNYGTML